MDDPDLLDALALLLADRGLGTYDAAGGAGDIFTEDMGDQPDEAVGLWLYDASEAPDARNADDVARLQVRTRAAQPHASRRRARAIYDALHGLAGAPLADGSWLTLAAADSVPYPLGRDEAGRFEHVTNYTLDIAVEPTSNRT